MSPERGLLTKVWMDRRQNRGLLGETAVGRPWGGGQSTCPERPVRLEWLRDEGAPADDRGEGLELGVWEDHAGRGAAVLPAGGMGSRCSNGGQAVPGFLVCFKRLTPPNI